MVRGGGVIALLIKCKSYWENVTKNNTWKLNVVSTKIMQRKINCNEVRVVYRNILISKSKIIQII